jgi:hypothetical protein
VSRCRSCGAQIRWANTERGKVIPLDPEPVPAEGPGRFVLRHDNGYLLAVAVPGGAYPDEPNFVAHFSTCPNAKQHRRSA